MSAFGGSADISHWSRRLSPTLLMLWTAPTLRHQGAIGWLRRNEPLEGSRPWARLARSVSISRSVFQIHGVDAGGAVVIRKRMTRAKLLEFFAALPSCLVGIEACPSAHYWSRRLQALGYTVRLLPPSYVKAYAKGLSPRLWQAERETHWSGRPTAVRAIKQRMSHVLRLSAHFLTDPSGGAPTLPVAIAPFQRRIGSRTQTSP
jgi:hypothetical protein